MVPLAAGVYTYQSALVASEPKHKLLDPAPVAGPSAKWVPGTTGRAVRQLSPCAIAPESDTRTRLTTNERNEWFMLDGTFAFAWIEKSWSEDRSMSKNRNSGDYRVPGQAVRDKVGGSVTWSGNSTTTKRLSLGRKGK